MPELPEVETIKKDLEKKILDIRISDVSILLPRIIKSKPQTFKQRLTGNKFTKIERVGKLMIFYLEKGEKKLLVHLKMTGQLAYLKGKRIIAGGHDDKKDVSSLPNPWTRVIITFKDKSKVYFNDMRTFGYMKLVKDKELGQIISRFGVEPLSKDFTVNILKQAIKGRQTSIKAVLLNQALIAGIGNIYADEALFVAGIRPSRKARTLKQKEIERLRQAIKQVLRKAIKYRGTTFNNYIDANGNKGDFIRLLKVYGRTGKKCKRCKASVIEKIKVAQRGTHYCKVCQK